MSKKQKRVLWPLLSFLLIAVCVLMLARSSSVAGNPPKNEISKSPRLEIAEARAPEVVKAPNTATPVEPARGQAQIVRFTRYDVGLFPREARVSAGLVVIQFADMTGSAAGLVVQDRSKLTLGQIARAAHSLRGDVRLHLEPGQYRVFDANQPSNSATLIVEP